MDSRIEEFLRWLEARGIADERLLEYRECAEQILIEASGAPIEAIHVEAARRSLQARGARPRTLARVDDAGDALLRFQRPPPGRAPPGPPASPGAASAAVPDVPRPPADSALRGRRLLLAVGVSLLALVIWIAGVYAYLTRPEEAAGPGVAPQAALSAEEREIHRVYLEFQSALLAEDLQRLRAVLVPSQIVELSGPDAEQKLSLAKSFYPKDVELGRAEVRGDSAVLSATARLSDQRATGRIELEKQGGVWRVGKADWTMKFGDSAAQKRNVARPADLPSLRGTWKGKETGNDTEWTIRFSEDDRLAATSNRGETYEGDVVIRWDLGVENGTIHVPPGWGPLDVEIDKAASPQAVGKVTLSAFSLTQGELRLCGGAPGRTSRVRSFESPGPGFRCVVLRKVSVTSDAPPTEAAAQPDDAGPGEATLTLDGVVERYELKTGFLSDTRVAKPEEATLHFAVRAPRNSNARRILLTLDGTHAGSHYADGQAIHDMMFNEKPATVGRTRAGEWVAIFKWIADGGQHFPPKIGTRCEIRVTSVYTGSERGVFSAEIPHCVVHSAGIDHTLSRVKLEVRGKLDR